MKNNLKYFCFFCCVTSFLFSSCVFGDAKKTAINSATKLNQDADIPPDSLSKVSLPEMEMNNFRSIKDTIIFTSPTPFLYFPFGKFNNEVGLLNAYPGLKLSYQKYVDNTGTFELYKYEYEQSFIKMIKNDESGLFDIVHAKLVNNGIILKNGEQIGSSKSSFIKKFFKPIVKLKKYNVIKIESLILGIIHVYTFKDDKLVKVMIDSDYQVNKY
jgi:hypothetical protein